MTEAFNLKTLAAELRKLNLADRFGLNEMMTEYDTQVRAVGNPHFGGYLSMPPNADQTLVEEIDVKELLDELREVVGNKPLTPETMRRVLKMVDEEIDLPDEEIEDLVDEARQMAGDVKLLLSLERNLPRRMNRRVEPMSALMVGDAIEMIKKQSISKKRNSIPLCVAKDEDGKWKVNVPESAPKHGKGDAMARGTLVVKKETQRDRMRKELERRRAAGSGE